MPLPNTFAELIKNIHNYTDLVIEFKKDVDAWAQYPEANMRAQITNGRLDYNEDEVGRITFDYTKFDDFNKQFESSDYYDKNQVHKNQVPCLTARQAGLYNPVDTIYILLTDDPNKFMNVVSVSQYYEQYLANRTDKQSYVNFLETRLSALELEMIRINLMLMAT